MIQNIKGVKKTVLSTHLVVCILIYIFKLKNILNNQNSNLSNSKDIHSSKLLNFKKITDLGVDLVSKNYFGFLFHILPYASKIISKGKFIKSKILSSKIEQEDKI